MPFVDLFEFVMLLVHWGFEYASYDFIKFGRCLALISLNILNSLCVSLRLCVSLSPSWVLTMHLLIHLVMSHTPLRLCSLFLMIFCLCSSDSMISLAPSLHLLILDSFLGLLTSGSDPQWTSYFNYCTIQLQYFYSVAFNNIYFLSNILHLFIHHSPGFL